MRKLKESRTLSFAVVTAVYIIAAVIGVITYRALSLDWWLSLLIADAVALIVTFIFSIIFGNASVYDPYWSVQPPVILIAFAIGKELTALGVMLIFTVGFLGSPSDRKRGIHLQKSNPSGLALHYAEGKNGQFLSFY